MRWGAAAPARHAESRAPSEGARAERVRARAALATTWQTRSQPELLRDDHLHDLVGSGVDALDAGIHEGARDRVLEHVAVAAEELQAGVDDLLGHLGLPELGHRALGDQRLAGDMLRDEPIEEGAADLDLRRALDELELRVLEL